MSRKSYVISCVLTCCAEKTRSSIRHLLGVHSYFFLIITLPLNENNDEYSSLS